MATEYECIDCASVVDYLEVFPGPRCLSCHAVTPEARRPMTARELSQMWGGR